MCPFDSRGGISSSSGCSRVRAFGDKFLSWVVAEITHGRKSGGLQGWSVAKLAPWPLGVRWALWVVAWRRWGAGQRAKAGPGRCGCQPHLLGLPHCKALTPACALSFSRRALACHLQPLSFQWFILPPVLLGLGFEWKGTHSTSHAPLLRCLPCCSCLFIKRSMQVTPRNCLYSLISKVFFEWFCPTAVAWWCLFNIFPLASHTLHLQCYYFYPYRIDCRNRQ